MLVGALLTILLNSSSVFTSALTPLVGVGVVTLERMYPLTLGANIGTTFTAILASLAQDSDTIENSLQVSMCHLFFNISGIVIWYPIPLFRKLPIHLAKKLGDTTAKYRWFAVLYLIVIFFVLPLAIFGLSAASPWVLAGVIIPALIFILVIVIINVLQTKKPRCLPAKLQTWEFLPLCCHSFKPLDGVITRLISCCPCCKKDKVEPSDGASNKAYEEDEPVSKM